MSVRTNIKLGCFVISIVSVFYILIFIVLGITYAQGIVSLGDIFSLGQLLVELCLLPITIFGFIVAFNELRASQERASLDICWNYNGMQSKKIVMKREGGTIFVTPSIFLKNEGNAPSIIYKISLFVPDKWGNVSGKNREWKHNHDTERLTFSSSDPYISFPQAPAIDLGGLEFSANTQLPKELVIKYDIFSDKSPYVKSELQIVFID